MHEITLLLNIAVALVVAFLGGVFIGPFTPGVVGDSETISQAAEIDEGGYQNCKSILNRKGA